MRKFFRSAFNQKLDGILIVSEKKFNLEAFVKAFQDLCDGIDLLNSTFTYQLAPIFVNAIATLTFAGYGVLWEVVIETDFRGLLFLQNGSWLCFMYIVIVVISFVGSSVTHAAEETSLIMMKIINNSQPNESFANSMQKFVTRVNCRSMHVQNCFFKINPMLLVYVKLICAENCSKITKPPIPQATSTIVTYLVITCQFEATKVEIDVKKD